MNLRYVPGGGDPEPPGSEHPRDGVPHLPGEQSKMAMQSSHGAAAMAEQPMAGQQETGGVSDMVKKLFKG